MLAFVLAAGAAGVVGLSTSLAAATPAFSVPWWAVALLVALSETRAIDFHYRGHTHSFTFSEIPLVLALFILSPAELVLAVASGSSIGLAVTRSQPSAKGVFNVAQYALAAAVAAFVFASLRTGAPLPGLRDWVAVLGAVVVANFVGVVAIAAVIRLTGGTPSWRDTVQAATIAMAVGVANASLALLLMTILVVQPVAALLLILPASMLYVAYNSYITERARHQRIEHLYEATRILQGARDVDVTVQRLLTHARQMFSVEAAELTIFVADDADLGLRAISTGAAPVVSGTTMAPDARDRVRGPALADPTAYRLVPGSDWEHGPIENGLACALRGDARTVGVIVVANRDPAAGRFSRDDLRLLETLSSHAASAFDNAELTRSLASMSRQRDSLTVTATHDPLTRLPNRLQFLEELNRRMSTDVGSVPSVLFIDLDDFKEVNDRWGHAVGDAVLSAVAGRIQHAISSADLPARLGGDEFAVIVDDTADLRGAQRIAHRILEELGSPIAVNDAIIEVRASIGVAAPRAGMDPSTLLSFADGAMYRAKAAGKHRVSFAAPLGDADDAARSPGTTLTDLALVYQPVIDLGSQHVVSYEALLRTVRADGTPVAPDELLLALDDTSTQRAVARWVVSEVTETMRRAAHVRPDAPALVSVNLTATQLMDPHLIDDVARALQAAKLAPSQLSLEVSEGAIVPNRHLATRRVDQLRALGTGIILDDFGAGISALDALAELPLSAVKTAARFVHEEAGSDRRMLLPGMVALARSLSLRTVAKGIETDEQARFARQSGCDGGQGYLLGMPMPTDELLHSLSAERPVPGRSRGGRAQTRVGVKGALGG